MNLSCIVFGVLFCLTGVLMAKGKLHRHLAAWKQMPEDEKEKIRIGPLCRNIGEVIILSGLIFLMKGLWTGFQDHWFVGALVAWLIVAGLDVFYIGKSNRYLNRKKEGIL